MFKSNLLCVLLLLSANLNADELVSLEEDKNMTKVLSRNDLIENHNVKFALELGAKVDFWEPGLSEKEGQNLLKYDTEGLYLGYVTLKTKIYDTDVFTLEKFGTLISNDEQNALLKEYKSDKKKESSVDGYRMSIHLMKVLNYWFDSDFLSGLEYRYKTRNFIGEAKLQYDALYWFGESPGFENIDFFSYDKDSVLSFKTKFIDHRLLYKWEELRDARYYLSFGAFDSKWSKPTYIGINTNDGEPVIAPGDYRIKGLAASLGLRFENFGFDFYLDYGLSNKFEIIDGTSVEQFNSSDMDLSMYTYGATMEYRIPNIYSNSYLKLDFILSGDIYGAIIGLEDDNNLGVKLDKELLYGVKTALEFTF